MPLGNKLRTGSSRDYKRGAVMGLTVAEAFILLTFVLLLLFTWWQADAQKKNLAAAELLGDMTNTQRRELIGALSDGTMEMAKQLREAGVKAGDSAALADASSYTRFMREEDLKRLLQRAVELSPDTKLSLADAVEITPEMELRAALADLVNPDDAMAKVSRRLAEAAAAQERAVSALNAELGDKIRAAGGAISADGTIALPQNILFERSSAEITNKAFLREFCAPWVRTLRTTNIDVSELKIEGHASSEGLTGHTPEQAYLYNLDLSQKRAQNALKICLEGLKDPAILDWARDHLSSTGYSSAKPVLDEMGAEDREASRRVMFSMEMNREKLIEDIKDDLRDIPGGSKMSPSRAESLADAGRSGGHGTTRVIDGDTIAIGDVRWRLLGVDAPEMKQDCRKTGGEAYPCGRAARDALVELIGDLDVSCDEIVKDRYGRSVGICRAGGKDLGEELVSLGMAVPYLKYSDAYKPQGEAARAAKLGLWSGDFEMPNEFRKLN